MNEEPTPQLLFLHDPTPGQLLEAVASNHRELFVLQAQAIGGEVHEAEGVTWTYAGSDGDAMILFPRLRDATAGDQLDTIVEFYRARQPTQLVGCWSLDPPEPPDLEIRLLARGFQPGWRPCWMWLDLEQMRTDHPMPAELQIEQVEQEPTWDVDDLPYYQRDQVASQHAVTRLRPQRVWHFAAFVAGRVVGHSTLCLTIGPLGVAGIYGVGVVPAARNHGVGKAVTLAACRQARALGCRHALLNATGERMYRQLGFERLGYGQTWWLNVPRLEARLPTRERIALTEAVGRGDLKELAALGPQPNVGNLDEPLANEMTLLELAAHADQPAAAEWLIAHGAILDIIPAWDLGWKDRVAQLLAEQPTLVNRRLGEMQITPLHVAAERNDVELARVVLAADPNLTITDACFGATALGWAMHFQHTAIIELIEQHQARQSES